MLFKLNKDNFYKARSLFKSVEENYLVIKSVFEGNIYGEIYVDNLESPSLSLLSLPHIRNFHLVGDNVSITVAEDLKLYLADNIFSEHPELKGKSTLVLSEEHLFDSLTEIFGDLEKFRKCYYEIKDLDNYNFKLELPKNYKLVKIDSNLLKRTDLLNYDIIPGWIEGTWTTQEHYITRGFGNCVIYKDKEIASVVFCCYIDENIHECELGVITFPNHRQKGLAKITTATAIEHCKQIGIQRIHWHCRDTNIASKKTAEAVGFKLQKKGYEFQGQWQ